MRGRTETAPACETGAETKSDLDVSWSTQDSEYSRIGQPGRIISAHWPMPESLSQATPCLDLRSQPFPALCLLAWVPDGRPH